MSEEPEVYEVQKIEVDNSVMLTAREKAEIDIAVATAKRYPRSIKKSLSMALEMATLNEDVAESCFYSLKRKDNRTGETKFIEGPSVRTAEIMASAWGNLAVDTQITGEDDKFIYATATCRDLERNLTVRKQVRRRITTSETKNGPGRRYSDDMIAVTANAAASIALRNAVLSVVPGAYTKQVYDAAKAAAMGDSETLEKRRQKAIDYVRKANVSDERIFAALGVGGTEDISLEKLVQLRGMCTAIKDNETTVDEQFPPVIKQAPGQSRADALAENMKAQTQKPAPATVPAEPPGKPEEEGPMPPEASDTTAPEARVQSKADAPKRSGKKDPFAKKPKTERAFDPTICKSLHCGNVKIEGDRVMGLNIDCADMQECKREQ